MKSQVTLNPIVFLWTAPRSLSTVFEKSVAQLEGVRTFHEPFSKVYYGERRGPEFTDKHGVSSFEQVVNDLIDTARRETVFVKELAYCARGCKDFKRFEWFFRDMCTHTFLIRDPQETVPSLSAQMKKVYGPDIDFGEIADSSGVKKLAKMYDNAVAWGQVPPVVDASCLTEHPSKVLQMYCARAGLKYSEKMLQWKEGILPDWTTWSQYGWHDQVEKTTTFVKPQSTYEEELADPRVSRLIIYLEPYYFDLRDKRLSCTE